MKEYETAFVRPTPFRSLLYWMKREILNAMIQKAEDEEERRRLIKERDKLCDIYETRGKKK